MGEELELGNLFIVCDDGTYVPFEGITEINPNDIQTDAAYDPIVPIDSEPITLELDMKRREHRKLLKIFKQQINAASRRVRYSKRKKERARRSALKDAKEKMRHER